jgi:hypothetical protein
MSGHVATTIVVAQIMAPRNGRKIQIEEPIKATIKSTANTSRVISRCISIMSNLSERLFLSVAPTSTRKRAPLAQTA